CIKAKLQTRKFSRCIPPLHQITIAIPKRNSVFEILNTVKYIRSIIILNEFVHKAKDLITGTQRQFMISHEISEIISNLNQILIQHIGLRKTINAHIDAPRTRPFTIIRQSDFNLRRSEERRV